MTSIRRIIFSAVVVLCCAAPLGAQVVVEYLNPPFGVGARMAALAESDVSETRDVSGMYWNPASLVELTRPTLAATNQRTSYINNYLAAFSFNFDRADVIGLGGMMTSFPEATIGSGTRVSPVQYGIDFAYAHYFNIALSVGVRLSGRYGQADNAGLSTSGVTAGFASIGVVYTPVPNFSYAAVYNAMGMGIHYLSNGSSLVFQEEHLPGSIEVGVALRYPSTMKYRLLTMSISNEKIIENHDMRYKFGMELLPMQFIAVRFGYYVEPTMTRPTYGAGLRFGPVALDYAYVPHKYVEEIHQFSLSAIF